MATNCWTAVSSELQCLYSFMKDCRKWFALIYACSETHYQELEWFMVSPNICIKVSKKKHAVLRFREQLKPVFLWIFVKVSLPVISSILLSLTLLSCSPFLSTFISICSTARFLTDETYTLTSLAETSQLQKLLAGREREDHIIFASFAEQDTEFMLI